MGASWHLPQSLTLRRGGGGSGELGKELCPGSEFWGPVEEGGGKKLGKGQRERKLSGKTHPP